MSGVFPRGRKASNYFPSSGRLHISPCDRSASRQRRQADAQRETYPGARGWDDPLRPPRLCFHLLTPHTDPPLSPSSLLPLLSSVCSRSPLFHRHKKDESFMLYVICPLEKQTSILVCCHLIALSEYHRDPFYGNSSPVKRKSDVVADTLRSCHWLHIIPLM